METKNIVPEPSNFIEDIISDDLASGKHADIVTRFPPEPNGYLHVGHAKAICINFGIKAKYNGKCNLRFDDTNPVKEDVEYSEAIKEDIAWLGFSWDELCYASEYFDTMYEKAVLLIKKGLAYVCDFTAEQIKETRGTLTEAGSESPYRQRSVAENLELFEKMKGGAFPDGTKVLRAKIDMAAPNINMRDPVIYRILTFTHPHVGDKWKIYPMYDFAHPLEDAIEGITHSLCSLEFENHRPLYDWFVENCEFEKRPRQIEFARLNLTHSVMSKRYLKKLVDDGVVTGWDDPRLYTIRGMRKRGYPPEAIVDFCNRIGVAKANSEVDVQILEHCVRENLNINAERRMTVVDPLRVVLENYPEGKTEEFSLQNNPNKTGVDGTEDAGSHKVSFSREIFIEREDFELDPPPKFFRMKIGGTVRLKGAYIIKCTGVETDSDGNVTCVKAEIIENSQSGGENSGMKVKGTIHWVNALDAVPVKLNLFDYLIEDGEGDFSDRVNKNSWTVVEKAVSSAVIRSAKPLDRYQFLRKGYFVAVEGFDPKNPEFNEVVGLKDGYKKA